MLKLQKNLHPHDVAFHGISRRQPEVFMLQIGAADGVRADPVHHFVRRYNWEGVLVEPLPDLFGLLKENYNGQPGLKFENAAVTESSEKRLISRVPLDSVAANIVPRWAFGISSLVPEKAVFSPEHTQEHIYNKLQDERVEQEIDCISLQELIEKHHIHKVDILQIDTEGYDANVIRQIDFEIIKPTFINYEVQWLSEAETAEVTSLLESQGYSLYDCGEDTLASLVNLEEYITINQHADKNSVPRFAANIIGFISNNIVDYHAGACQSPPAQTEFVKAARELHVAVQSWDVMSAILPLINGRDDIAVLSKQCGIPEHDVIGCVKQLQNMYILDTL